MFFYQHAPILNAEQVVYLSLFSIVTMGICYYFQRKDEKKVKTEKSDTK